MKKKIINGILMVALLAATSASFVSCKDNDEDLKIDLLAASNYQQLDNKIQQLENDLQTAQNDITNLKNTKADQADLDDLADQVGDLQDELDDLKDRVDALEGDVDAINDAIDDINDRLDDIEDRLDDIEAEILLIEDALENLITSVTVNATATDILSNSKLIPGLNMQFLGACYGEAKVDVEFPSVDKGYINDYGVKLFPGEIANVEVFKKDQGELLYNTERGAGSVFFTINPSNIDDLEDVTLSLINSKGEENYLTLGAAQPAEKELKWGQTRGDAPTLWESHVAFKDDPVAIGQIDPTQIIKIEPMAEHIKAMIDAASATEANTSSVKATAKNLLKEAAGIFADLAQAKIPELPAMAVKAEWTDMVGTRSVISDYSIAATAYKPVGFTFGQGNFNDLKNISFERLDNAFARVINNIKSKLPGEIKEIKFSYTPSDDLKIKVQVEVPDGATVGYDIDVTKETVGGVEVVTDVTVTINDPEFKYDDPSNDVDIDKDFNAAIEDILNSAIPLDEINSMINQLNSLVTSINDYADRAKNLENRITDYLGNFINKYINIIAKHGFTSALQPIMLYQNGEGVNRLAAEGLVLEAGEYDLLPTTVTNELIAPTFKKYIAIIDKSNNQVVESALLTKGDKNFKKYTVNLKKGNYNIVYAALDFYGYQIAKRYNITVK